MHLVLLIAAGIFLTCLAICLAPVVAGLLVIASAIMLCASVDLLEWIIGKFRRP